jgi:hypothetical protein
LSERLLTEARIVVWYLSVLLWPDPSRLSIEHDIALSQTLWNPPSTLFCIVLLVTTAWLSIRFRRRFPLITYGMLWFLLNLVIESSIVPLELIFEHRLYLPSIGFYIALVAGLVSAHSTFFNGTTGNVHSKLVLLFHSGFLPDPFDLHTQRSLGRTF